MERSVCSDPRLSTIRERCYEAAHFQPFRLSKPHVGWMAPLPWQPSWRVRRDAGSVWFRRPGRSITVDTTTLAGKWRLHRRLSTVLERHHYSECRLHHDWGSIEPPLQGLAPGRCRVASIRRQAAIATDVVVWVAPFSKLWLIGMWTASSGRPAASTSGRSRRTAAELLVVVTALGTAACLGVTQWCSPARPPLRSSRRCGISLDRLTPFA
jgi:hypothetical protein